MTDSNILVIQVLPQNLPALRHVALESNPLLGVGFGLPSSLSVGSTGMPEENVCTAYTPKTTSCVLLSSTRPEGTLMYNA